MGRQVKNTGDMEISFIEPPTSRAYALLNDSEHTISASVIDALRNYDVHPALWSGREDVRMELAA